MPIKCEKHEKQRAVFLMHGRIEECQPGTMSAGLAIRYNKVSYQRIKNFGWATGDSGKG